jgi:hypothetical protein
MQLFDALFGLTAIGLSDVGLREQVAREIEALAIDTGDELAAHGWRVRKPDLGRQSRYGIDITAVRFVIVDLERDPRWASISRRGAERIFCFG